MSATICVAATSACAPARVRNERRPAEGAGPTVQAEGPILGALPGDWDRVPPSAFEVVLEKSLPRQGDWAFTDAELALLGGALDEADQRAVRAAVLLGRSGDPRASAALIERLERRAPAPARERDAGDVVAAAALAGHAGREPADGIDARLAALADGPNAHPDLEVRVECARVALAAGHDEVTPFLLRVLRAMTPAEDLDPPDWPFKTTLTWAKQRASEALSARAGVPCTFVPDASYANQAEEARRLAAALGL